MIRNQFWSRIKSFEGKLSGIAHEEVSTEAIEVDIRYVFGSGDSERIAQAARELGAESVFHPDPGHLRIRFSTDMITGGEPRQPKKRIGLCPYCGKEMEIGDEFLSERICDRCAKIENLAPVHRFGPFAGKSIEEIKNLEGEEELGRESLRSVQGALLHLARDEFLCDKCGRVLRDGDDHSTTSDGDTLCPECTEIAE